MHTSTVKLGTALAAAVFLLARAGPAPASRCEPVTNPGYSVAVVERAVGPGGGSVVSKANGTSTFNYNMNPGYVRLARACVCFFFCLPGWRTSRAGGAGAESRGCHVFCVRVRAQRT